MSSAVEAIRAPRTRSGLARRSLFNTSFPVKRTGEKYYVSFVAHGRVKLDVHTRVTPAKFEELASRLASTARTSGEFELDAAFIRSLTINAEVALFHYVADRIADGKSNSSNSTLLIVCLAELLESSSALSEGAAAESALIIRKTLPELKEVFSRDVGLTIEKLRACIDPRKQERTKREYPAINVMLDGFLDDWTRRTERAVRYTKSPGNAYDLYISALKLMKSYPPDPLGCPVRTVGAQLLLEPRRNFHEPWLRAVRSAAD